MASESVTVGSSPSGTSATMTPMAKMKFDQNGKPRTWPITKNTVPIVVASNATIRLTCPISR
jgi:hypothetical protein